MVKLATALVLIFFASWLGGFPVIIYTMPDLPVMYGPRTSSTMTMGIFAPSGFIRFELTPQVKSINGLRHWQYEATEITSDLWPATSGEGGDNWGNSITDPTYPYPTKPIEIYLNIPDDTSLARKKATIQLNIYLKYPVPAETEVFKFTDEGTRIQETITFSIDQNQKDPVSGFDRAKCGRCTATDKNTALGGWLILYPIFWIIAGIAAANVISRRRRKHLRPQAQ